MPNDEIVSVRYMVDDVDEAIAFYTKLLGFESTMSAAPAFAEVRRGNLRLLLSGPKSSAGRPMDDGTQPAPGGWNRIHFIVDDFDTEVARLTEAGRVVPQSSSDRSGRQADPAARPVGQLRRDLRTRRTLNPGVVRVRLRAVLTQWGRIGCIGFGGPPTHIALLRDLVARAPAMDVVRTVRGRGRRVQPPSGARVDPAGDPLRVECRRSRRRDRRRPGVHPPGARRHPRPRRRVPRRIAAHMDRRRGRRRGRGRCGGRRPRRDEPRARELGACAGSRPLGGLRARRWDLRGDRRTVARRRPPCVRGRRTRDSHLRRNAAASAASFRSPC